MANLSRMTCWNVLYTAETSAAGLASSLVGRVSHSLHTVRGSGDDYDGV